MNHCCACDNCPGFFGAHDCGADPRGGSLPLPQRKTEAEGLGSTPTAPTIERLSKAERLEARMEHFGSPEGYAGVPIDPALKHDPHCCAARGCHQVCSHLCGTDLATHGCCGE